MNVGDTVRLKSGGPVMTVDSVDQGQGTAHCIWMKDETPMARTFSIAALETKPTDPYATGMK